MIELARGSFVAAAIVFFAGCLESRVEECSDGTVCPGDKICDIETDACVDPAILLVEEASIDLGDLPCGEQTQTRVKLRNLRDVDVPFTASSSLSIVSLTPATGVVPANGFVEVEVRADATGDMLVGGAEGVVVFSTPSATISRLVEFDIYGGVVTTDVSGLDFGISGLSNGRVERSVTLRNNGNAEVEFSLATPRHPFSLQALDNSPLQPGEARELVVGYEPSTIGTYADTLGLSFSGVLCQAPPSSVALSAVADDVTFSVDTALLDFGASGCNVEPKSLSVYVTNNSGQAEDLQMHIIGGDAENYVVDHGVSLEPAASTKLTVLRKEIAIPTVPRARSAILRIVSSPSGEQFDIQLRHRVDAPYIQALGNLDFGTVSAQSSQSRTLSVENTGNLPGGVIVALPQRGIIGGGRLTINPTAFSLGPKSSTNQSVDVTVTAEIGNAPGHTLTTDLTVNAPGQCNVEEVFTIELEQGAIQQI